MFRDMPLAVCLVVDAVRKLPNKLRFQMRNRNNIRNLVNSNGVNSWNGISFIFINENEIQNFIQHPKPIGCGHLPKLQRRFQRVQGSLWPMIQTWMIALDKQRKKSKWTIKMIDYRMKNELK